MAEIRQFLMFNLSGETYGVAIHTIREILEYPGVTTIPMAPAFLRGVINLRGAVVPVLDLSVRFGRAPTVINRRTCIVIMEVPQGKGEVSLLGVIVDGVTEVREVNEHEVERQPGFGAGLRNDFLTGMLRREQGFIPILAIDAVLAEDALQSLIELGEDQPGLARAG